MFPGRGCSLLAAVLAGALAACVPVEQSGPEVAQTPACQVRDVVDGDTVFMSCGDEAFVARLQGFDTPEVTSPGCAAEAAAGARASQYLDKLVRSGPVTGAERGGLDRYGRELVRLEIGGRDVAAEMIGAGLALPYSGGQRPNWCARL